MTDKDIRDLMLNGEEKVPSHVWSNIRSRINPAPFNGAWVFGLALAGIAAIALIIPLTLKKAPASPETKVAEPAAKVIVVDGTAEQPVSESRFAQALPQAEARKDAALHAKSVQFQNSGSAAAVQDEALTTLQSDDAPATVFDSGSEPSDSTVSVSDDENKTSTPQKSRSSVDPFAIMAMEDSRKDPGYFSITAGSSVSGNDSDFLGESSTMYRSSSAGIRTNDGITETGPSVYGIPVTFSLGFRYFINEKFSIGSGVTYSLLTRTFTGNYTQNTVSITETNIRHNMQYIGIPVNAYYSIIGNKVIDFHVFAGGSIEFCASSSYRIGQVSQGDIQLREPVHGPQMSAAIGLGASFRLNNFLSICVDPSARYYFRSSHPKSLRTDKPFMINMELGLKFDL